MIYNKNVLMGDQSFKIIYIAVQQIYSVDRKYYEELEDIKYSKH